MHTPVLETAPGTLPVSMEEAKQHLRVDHADDDAAISVYLNAAVRRVERACNIALSEQTWRQDFDALCQILRLPVGPATSITSVTVRNEAGQLATVADENYALYADELGSYLRFKDDYDYPSDLYEKAAVRVTWKAGNVEAPVKAAILLLTGDLYENREAKIDGGLQENGTVKALLAPYRVFS